MDPMPPVRMCMSSTWATSSTTSHTPSRTRAATPSSSNGVTTTSPGALTKWPHNYCTRTAPKSLPLSSTNPPPFSHRVHWSAELPRTFFFLPLRVSLQWITTHHALQGPLRTDDRLPIVPKFSINSRNDIDSFRVQIQSAVKVTAWSLSYLGETVPLSHCERMTYYMNDERCWNNQQYITVMQCGFVWFQNEKLTFCNINLFLVSLCRPNKDLMANFPDKSDWTYWISCRAAGPSANSPWGISYVSDFNSSIRAIFRSVLISVCATVSTFSLHQLRCLILNYKTGMKLWDWIVFIQFHISHIYLPLTEIHYPHEAVEMCFYLHQTCTFAITRWQHTQRVSQQNAPEENHHCSQWRLTTLFFTQGSLQSVETRGIRFHCVCN